MYDYQKIKKLGKQMKINVPNLIVLSLNNDPFYIGSKTNIAMAEWFADLWERFHFPHGVHLRRIHYQLLAPGDVKNHDGMPYENTANHWDYLNNASKFARHLKLVSADAFTDQRNPNPQIFHFAARSREPLALQDFPLWTLPTINTEIDTYSVMAMSTLMAISRYCLRYGRRKAR
jgi:hypothetical protein